MRHLFLYLFPYTLFIYPTLSIYLIIAKRYNGRSGQLEKDGKVGRHKPTQPDLTTTLQRFRANTNLLTARQSMNLILIVVLVGASHSFINIVAPHLDLRMPPLLR